MSPLCSRNARSQKTLVGRAQWGTHPSPHRGKDTSRRGDTIFGLALLFYCSRVKRPGILLRCRRRITQACPRIFSAEMEGAALLSRRMVGADPAIPPVALAF